MMNWPPSLSGLTRTQPSFIGSAQSLIASALNISANAMHNTGAVVPVTYTGILPDLFREGQGVVAEGALDAKGVIKADNVLAKHDERYMPREVADALKKQGVWNEGQAPAKGDAKQGGK